MKSSTTSITTSSIIRLTVHATVRARVAAIAVLQIAIAVGTAKTYIILFYTALSIGTDREAAIMAVAKVRVYSSRRSSMSSLIHIQAKAVTEVRVSAIRANKAINGTDVILRDYHFIGN